MRPSTMRFCLAWTVALAITMAAGRSAGAAPAAEDPGQSAVDVAPFGQVAAWDPSVMQGTSARRLQEFPAADIDPAKEILPAKDGSYTVPLWGETGCIGLRWNENRLLARVALRLVDTATAPPPESIRLQYWTGESAWQGNWQPAQAAAEKAGDRLVWSLAPLDRGRGIQKVRWVFSDVKRPIAIAGLSAYTRSSWQTVKVRLESAAPASGKAQIELYNGTILDPQGETPYRRTWDRSTPLSLTVWASVADRYKVDRTVLRFQLPEAAFGVAVEDLLANDCVYVPHAGLFATREPAPVTLDEYRKKIASQATVLARVRGLPDQDFAKAMSVVHNPVQDLGPMMLSLACDNRKFVAQREGTLVFDEYDRPNAAPRPFPNQWQLVPRFGSGKDHKIARQLTGGWLPMPTTTAAEGDVAYRQTSYVAPIGEAPADAPAWFRDRAVAVTEYAIANRGSTASEARLALSFVSKAKRPVELRDVAEGILAVAEDHVLALIDTRGAAPLAAKRETAGAIISGSLPAGAEARLAVYLPAWTVPPGEYAAILEGGPAAPRVEAYWNAVLAPAMHVELPDPLLTNVIRASQVHCLMAARNEERGSRVAPWISADRYGPWDSEAQAVIRGLDMTGNTEIAQRCLDYFITRYNKAGFLTTGYTVVGTGEHLWTLAEHYQRTRDQAWMKAIAPEVARVCQWVVAQRAKTKRTDARGEKVPEYGLMPPGVTADWNRFAYRFFNDAQYCAGLAAAGRVLAEVGHPAAASLLEDARQYRDDIRRAYRWTQARSPVVRLESGVWVPAEPSFLDCFGRIEEFLPGEDSNRTWCYSAEIGGHHLAATEVFDPTAAEVGCELDWLEDVQYLRSGWGDYPEERSRKDIFSLGGFGKLQPYYGRTAEVYALRDDVKPFVRAYFNAIPALLSRENLSFWEHFHNQGGWNKTHETAWFLCQSRVMLVLERGDELRLAPMVTNRWLRDGMKIAVRNAPTRFGPVSYRIESAASKGRIEATIEPPLRDPPQTIVIRLRHPDGKRIQSVAVQGKPHKEFDPEKETVTVPASAGPITVRCQYE